MVGIKKGERREKEGKEGRNKREGNPLVGVSYSQRYLFNANPDPNPNDNPTNPNSNRKR